MDMGDDVKALSYLNQALESIRAQMAASPNSVNLERDLPGCYDAFGKYHATLASRSGISGEQQIAHWREARAWYQQNLTGLQELIRRSPGDNQSARYAEEVSRKIAQCDSALASLSTKQQR